MANVRRMSLTRSLISALALSLTSTSIAPYLLIVSSSVAGKFLSECPRGSAVRKCDFRPMKNCAAVDPSSKASSLLYSVSVATSSCLRGMLRIGFGDRIWFRNECPSVAPLVPYCVVASNVFLSVAWSVPGKYLEYSATSFLDGWLVPQKVQ